MTRRHADIFLILHRLTMFFSKRCVVLELSRSLSFRNISVTTSVPFKSVQELE